MSPKTNTEKPHLELVDPAPEKPTPLPFDKGFDKGADQRTARDTVDTSRHGIEDADGRPVILEPPEG